MSRNKIIAIICVVVVAVVMLTGCSASFQRACVDLRSDIGGGLDRVVNVYTANGDLIAQYKGKIDLDANDGGYVKFDFNGRRYLYYNCFIESIADIN